MMYEVPQLHPLGMVKSERLLFSPTRSEILPALMDT